MIGTTLGHYRITGKLGQGGMGEVYLAEDTRLGREVALKTLPSQVFYHAELRQRLDREAKAIAALNHPGIVTIHSVEDAGDVRFITMELVRGKPLSELIPADGWPLGRTLDIAVALADAVAAAHQQGITHRDLKPGNVMLTDDGRVKVLDFGLAKLGEPDSAGDAATRIVTISRAGQVVGSAAYMSPEQAQGLAVDHRTDIFSLGIILFELASGRRPFESASVPGTMAAIIESPPRPLETLKPGLPDEFLRIVRRSMAKEPARRYQNALDLRNDLEDLKQTMGSTTSQTAPAVRARRSFARARWPIAASAIAILVAGLGYLLGARYGTTPPSALDGRFRRLTSLSGEELSPSLSPDGEFIVYTSRISGNWDIYLKRVHGEKPINLTEDSPADDRQPAFSADGRFIAFRSERDGGGIFVMGTTGENARKVIGRGYHPAWSPDGTEIAFAAADFGEPLARGGMPSELSVVSVASGSVRLVTKGDAVQPSWSPHGTRIAYWGVHQGGQRDIWTVPAAGGEPVQVTVDAAVDWNPVWSPDGRFLYFASDRGGSMNLWRVAIDERDGAVGGDPQAVTTPSTYSQHFSFSRDGRSLAYVEVLNRINLQQVGFDADRGRVVGDRAWITQSARPIKNPSVSPDGNWIVFDSLTDSQEDLFVMSRAGGRLRQVTDDAFKDRGARWSPDGRRIAFLSDRSGRYECWAVNPDGSGLKQLSVTSGPSQAQAPVWSPDGTRVACNTQLGAPIVIDTAVDSKAQTPVIASPGGKPDPLFFAWSWSPDGRALVGHDDRGIVSFTLGAERFQPLAGFGSYPLWLHDSRRVLFRDGGAIYFVGTDGTKPTEILSVAPDTIHSFTIAPDSRTLLLAVSTREADVWVASVR